MAQIIMSANVVVPNGPTLAFNRTLDIEAYDKIDVTILAAAVDLEVTLQPGDAGTVQFVAIVSDWFGDDLTYKINDTGGLDRELDQPHFLAGKGAISLFDDSVASGPPATLFFSNNSAQEAKVQILIGRDATP